MGTLRLDLPIEAMIKMKMEAGETEVLRLDIHRFTTFDQSALGDQGQFYLKFAYIRSAKFSYVLNSPYCRVIRKLFK